MKKLVSLTLAVLFVMVMACAAFAAETTFEGQYRVRAWSDWNFDKKPGDVVGEAGPLYTGFFDQRFRLTITHTRSEFLKAVVRLDLVEDTWGQQRNFRMNNRHRRELHRLGVPRVLAAQDRHVHRGRVPAALRVRTVVCRHRSRRTASSGPTSGAWWAFPRCTSSSMTTSSSRVRQAT